MLANGTVAPVESLRPGDVVLSYNILTHKFVPDIILENVRLVSHNEYIINSHIETDAGESFYTNKGWLYASQLKVGDELYAPLNNTFIPITSIKIIQNTSFVEYDLIGSTLNNFIADGYLADINTN